MSGHATYAPSSAKRWTKCTASAEAIAALGEQETNDAAEEGTAAHEEIERILGGLNGVSIVGGGDFTALTDLVNDDHPAAYGIGLVLDYARQLAVNTPGCFFVEQRVRLTEKIWGRCDVAHWDAANGVLTIIDYKNGFVGVDAEENEQLSIYALATIYTQKLPAKWVRLVVVQPNDFRPVPRVKQWVVDAETLRATAQPWASIPDGPKAFKAGEHCRYCPLFGRCDATRDLLAHLAIAMQHTPDDVPPATRAVFMALQKPIEDWFKGADKKWTADAMRNGAPEGLKLVQTTKHRAWTDEAKARAAIMAAHGPDALDVPTPAQAEKLGGIDVESLSVRPDGGPALAFANDKRKAWASKSAAEMFAGVTGK